MGSTCGSGYCRAIGSWNEAAELGGFLARDFGAGLLLLLLLFTVVWLCAGLWPAGLARVPRLFLMACFGQLQFVCRRR